MIEKYWERLLKQWRATGRTGLSIPFIIGSQQFLPEEHTRQSLKDLINDIAASSTTEVFLKYCMDINDVVIETKSASNRGSTGFYPNYRGKAQIGLFVSKQSRSEGNTVEEIIASLEERFEYFIDRGQFSLNNGQRGDFSAREKEFIRSCYEVFHEPTSTSQSAKEN